MFLSIVETLLKFSCSCSFKTSQLPEDDRESVTLKEYRAIIDVCMGGRVAEELSETNNPSLLLHFLTFFAVYGPDSVTSGASSDIRQATLTATKMVKVRLPPFGTSSHSNRIFSFRHLGFPRNLGQCFIIIGLLLSAHSAQKKSRVKSESKSF